jgi:hypothetical protein
VEGAGKLLCGLVPKNFHDGIADESGDYSNEEIGSSENIFKSPGEAFSAPHSRPFEFSHQKIGIEKENDKPYLG